MLQKERVEAMRAMEERVCQVVLSLSPGARLLWFPTYASGNACLRFIGTVG